MAQTKVMDLTEGPIMGKLIRFTIPIVLGNLLQQLYTAADRIVVGQFAADGAGALAAIGATASAINLLIGLFVGIATGTNVICANLLGAHNLKDLRKSMHTSILVGILCGVGMLLVGVLSAPLILGWMDTPASISRSATMYMQIYFLGVPASLVYNIGAGILRSYGDTKRPMFILILSGLINVVLNVVLVMGFHMDVAGVAIATVVSLYASAGAIWWILFNKNDQYRLSVKELSIDKTQLMAVIRVGVPSGLGSVVFSASNVILQSAVNSFDNAAIIAGKTAANDINVLIYQIEAGLLAACVSFSGQCYGAKKLDRIGKVATTATALSFVATAVLVLPCVLFSRQVIGLFNSDPEVMAYGSTLQKILNVGMLIYLPAETYLGCSRGMRRALTPTLLNIAAICGTRILWLLLVFPTHHTIEALYYCYPVSWAVSSVMQVAYFYSARKKESARLSQ